MSTHPPTSGKPIRLPHAEKLLAGLLSAPQPKQRPPRCEVCRKHRRKDGGCTTCENEAAFWEAYDAEHPEWRAEHDAAIARLRAKRAAEESTDNHRRGSAPA